MNNELLLICSTDSSRKELHTSVESQYNVHMWCKSKKLPTKQSNTAKWIWDSSIFSSIKPKHDNQSFVYFCVFPRIYLFCAENCSEHQNKIIQVRMGKNTKVNKQLAGMFWLNWRKHGSVWYSSVLSKFVTKNMLLIVTYL